ncbi:hypothetical protein ACFVZW_04190 [Streptomyces sp. NPDC059567]|uniref:hypothetical protein n=1 Tax=Streptomyces sp. NPDC059567 TaxID=3346867 RepID=UPI00367A4557
MRRAGLPYLTYYLTISRRQKDRGPVGPSDGKVRVFEESPSRLLDGERAPSLFFVWTPGPFDGAGELVPCTPQTCRRWVEAGLAYAAAMDDISVELQAAHRRAAAVPWWRHFAARRAMSAFEETRQRYERVMREASEAYEPVRREIREAVRGEKEKAVARARERERQEAEAWRRRRRLAEREVWGWEMVASEESAPVEGGGRQSAYVFRHDVPGGDVRGGDVRGDGPRVDLSGLRQALKELDLPDVVWDAAALAETERELVDVGFDRWWRDLFYEDYRTFTKPPPPPRPGPGATRPGNPSGGTATGGTGGFSGGFSCVGGF